MQATNLERADEAGVDRAQRNFTDPDSRILASRDGFPQGYNAQIAVDAARQVIVAQRLVTTAADYTTLVPLADAAHRTLGRKPGAVSADSGFATEANLAAMPTAGSPSTCRPGGAAMAQTMPRASAG
jgi:hypothetical protein